MGNQNKTVKIFNLDFEVEGAVRRNLLRLGRKPLEGLLSFKGLNNLYNDARNYEPTRVFMTSCWRE